MFTTAIFREITTASSLSFLRPKKKPPLKKKSHKCRPKKISVVLSCLPRGRADMQLVFEGAVFWWGLWGSQALCLLCAPWTRPSGESCRGGLEPGRTCRRQTGSNQRDAWAPMRQTLPRDPAVFGCFLFHFNSVWKRRSSTAGEGVQRASGGVTRWELLACPSLVHVSIEPQDTPGQGAPSCVYLPGACRSFGLIRGRVGLANSRNYLPSGQRLMYEARCPSKVAGMGR